MAGLTIYSMLLLGTSLAVLGSQHSPYSLQAAIDALHRREAQLALREEAAAEQLDEDGYWMEPTADEQQQQQFRPNRQRLNRILANYLRRDEEPEEAYDPYDLEARKRSVFRERDELPSYPTVFRERELEKTYPRPDLSSEFLKEVDRQAAMERDEEFQDRLQRLWNKYQQEENEIEQQLFEDEQMAPLLANGYEKRQGFPVSQSEPSAMYGPPMEERKRTLPILPWLPATRKKRFPVAKRSPKPEAPTLSGTDEKVAKDLQALFGAPSMEKEKRKRSSEPVHAPSSTVSSGVASVSSTPGSTTERVGSEATKTKRDSSDEHHEHSSEEGPDEEDHDHDHEHDHEESSEEFEGEDDDKKKRSVRKRSNLEVVKEDQILPGDIGEFKSKKSIQWNKYFGIDRRKKDGRSESGPMAANGAREYPLSFYKSYDEDRKKKMVNQDKLEGMDQKLKNIEDLILDQTVKYTGDHEGLVEPDELQKLKDKVVARLATAYSIEKMRHTLEKLKESVNGEPNYRVNEVEPDLMLEEKEKAKRVAIKKEKAEYDHNQHSMEGTDKVAHEEVENNLDELEADKKKKKRTQKRYQEVFRGLEEPEMDDDYNRGLVVESTDCPLLDAFERRCRGVDVLSGDIYQELLPACGAHQLCYLCGVSPKVCDLQYLSEADNICETQPDCLSTARSVLMILRGFPGPQLGPRECAKNPCLYRAMLEVGVVVN
ncbi:trichohyalin [Anopheles ziemanni]|uniref:trichohyalin n=1 Tax=Anopheles coustani TaxID=139045 RepID=UPI00265B47F2|nr:trichohyalin [Anopheles coustani]XP_058168957.1 trichohyalin [Anopheles ziemanni]